MDTATLKHDSDSRPLVAHVIFRLAVGGLENGLVNLINHLPRDSYRHAIICMRDITDFRTRITNPDVECFALHKREGNDLRPHIRLWRLLRILQPAIIHTRNLNTLECSLTAYLAGVRGRVHSEHGREGEDIDGRSRKFNLLRRGLSPLLHYYIGLSRNLEVWLRDEIHVPKSKLRQIYNGVDVTRFYPSGPGRPAIGPPEFSLGERLVIGTVGRMAPVKDQLTLAKAFVELLKRNHDYRDSLRLALVGDGPLRSEVIEVLREGDALPLSWLPGTVEDVPGILRGMDIFALPSLNEGISNGILEAMATGLPVVATRVGGNPELVLEGRTGQLVKPSSASAMADAIEVYVKNPSLAKSHGHAGRLRAEEDFSIATMVTRYAAIYDSLLR